MAITVGSGAHMPWRTEVAKTTSYTVLNSDHGTLFTTVGAGGAVTFTLPSLANGVGCFYWFSNQVAQNMAITAPANKLVAFNNATGTTATYSTAGAQIGSFCMVFLNGAGTFYIHVNMGFTTATIS